MKAVLAVLVLSVHLWLNPTFSCCFSWESSLLTDTNFKIAALESVLLTKKKKINLRLISNVLGVFFFCCFYGERDNRKGESLEKQGDLINVNVFLSSYCHSSEGVQTAWRLSVGWPDARCLCLALGIPTVAWRCQPGLSVPWGIRVPFSDKDVQRKNGQTW